MENQDRPSLQEIVSVVGEAFGEVFEEFDGEYDIFGQVYNETKIMRDFTVYFANLWRYKSDEISEIFHSPSTDEPYTLHDVPYSIIAADKMIPTGEVKFDLAVRSIAEELGCSHLLVAQQPKGDLSL